MLIVNGALIADVSDVAAAPSLYEPAWPVSAHPENEATPALAGSGFDVQLSAAPLAGWVAIDSMMDALEPVTTLLN